MFQILSRDLSLAEALELVELPYFFKGPLPKADHDECRIACIPEAPDQDNNILKMGEQTKAMGLQPHKHPDRKIIKNKHTAVKKGCVPSLTSRKMFRDILVHIDEVRLQ